MMQSAAAIDGVDHERGGPSAQRREVSRREAGEAGPDDELGRIADHEALLPEV